jgi:hypothetical protein
VDRPSILLFVEWPRALVLHAVIVIGALALLWIQSGSIPLSVMALLAAGMWAFLITAFYVRRQIDVKNWIRWRQADIAVIVRRAARPRGDIRSSEIENGESSE